LALLPLIAGPAPAETARHWTHGFAMPLFGLAIVLPFLFGLLGLAALVTLGLHTRKPPGSPAPLWPQLALMACAMPVLLTATQSTLVLLAFWPLVLLLGAHWHWRERHKGNPGFQPANTFGLGLMLVGLGLILWQAAGSLTKAALIGWTTLHSPGPGEPPFARAFDGTKYARPLTADYRLALHRFPDPAACLQPGADPATAGGLAQMDWTRITSQAEAEVCLFRLLASLPDGMADFTAFAEAQGLSVPAESFNPTVPYVEDDGTLRVTGYWSIRHKGPRYPTSGLIRIVNAVPYSMSVDATYTPDGSRLLHVRIGFNTL
jgi:hypothetical protein